jgi:hypothetical protein
VTAAEIPEPVRTHRADYWQWVEQHAAEPERGRLLALRDQWHAVNARHFGGALLLPYITLTEPSAPSIYGQTCPVSSWGSRLEIRLRPSLLAGTHPRVRPEESYAAGRFAFVADVLLHEMIHQWQQEATGEQEPGYRGHGPSFARKATEIGAALGLPPVRTCKRRGPDAELPSCARWPHNVRPVERYCGAYRPRFRIPASGDTCPRCHGTGRVSTAEREAP